jgi:uroporphyrinogen-III synthase
MSGLTGKRVVVTRATHQAPDLAQALTDYGATPLLYPCIAFLPPDDAEPLDDALRSLACFDWLLLTSANTVDALSDRLGVLDLPLPGRLRIGAVGTATARVAQRALGVTVTALPERFNAAALAEALPEMAGARVLLPQSAAADDTLAGALAGRGARVSAVTAYQVGIGTGGIDLPRLLATASIDAITLASGSAATNLVLRLEREGGDRRALEQVAIACIGESTAKAARQQSLRVDVVAETLTVEGLCAALDRYLRTMAEERVNQ